MRIEDFKEIRQQYEKNKDMVFKVLVNSQRAIDSKDRQISRLQSEVRKLTNTNSLPEPGSYKKEPSIIRAFSGRYRPKITIGIASYNHSAYLEQCIESALSQSYKNFEIVIVDDNSSDKKNRKILNKYKDSQKIKIIYKENNEGISASLNDQIINSDSEWVAFLDCDDYLPKNALSEMVKYIRRYPGKKLIFSNRSEVSSKGDFIRIVDFGNRGQNPDIFDELMKGMCSSHLKMVHKDVFRTAGLFDSKYDGIQDYDLYLRTATYLPKAIGHLDKSLYFHRIHDDQNTLVESKKHDRNVNRLKGEALFRKNVLENGSPEKISIIILSFNRGDQTSRCVDTVLKASKQLNTEIIIWDNGSTDKETLSMLKGLSKNKNIIIHYSDKNLMCSGGRKAAAKLATGKYLLFMDNDMEVDKKAIKELLIAIHEDSRIAAACCKVIFPNGHIQFNGATYKEDDYSIDFELIDNGKKLDDVSTFVKRRDCKWIPGGATLIKKEFFDKYEFDHHFINAYEDNDFYMRISKDGHMLVNSPLAISIHHHIEFDSASDTGTKHYAKVRRSWESLIKTWIYFYEKWGLVINEPSIYYLLGVNYGDDTVADQNSTYARDLEKQLEGVVTSISWKVTKPLRAANYMAKKILGKL